MKDLDTFMTWGYVGNRDVTLYICGTDYINNQPIVADDMKALIAEWWIHCNDLHCIVDLDRVNLLHLDIPGVLQLIRDLEEYNKGNFMLKSIRFTNSSTIHRWIYYCVRLGLSRGVRALISFA